MNKIYTHGYVEAFIFGNLLCDLVELTLTNDSHWSHYLGDNEISEQMAAKDKRQNKEKVEERKNL